MSLFETIDEISRQSINKTETGDSRIYGVMIGIIAANYDKDMPGRVCVTIPTRDKDANELKWARMAMPYGGSKWGHYFLPEVGDQVVLAFENGNIERPYIVGSIPLDNSKFLSACTDEANQYKRITSKQGSSVSFFDNKEGDGEKDSITISTAKNAHTILMDNDAKTIVIKDKSKENVIEIKTEEGSGSMSIKTKSSLTITVGDGIKLSMNGESGTVSLEAKSIKLSANQNIDLKTDAMIKLEAGQITEKASSLQKIESGGMLSMSGSPIKIG